MKVDQAKPIQTPVIARTQKSHGASAHGAPAPALKSAEVRERPQDAPDGIHVQLIAFGGTKTIVGANEVEYSLASPCSASEFLDQVCQSYPQLAVQRDALRLAVNGAYVGNEHRVCKGDEVALIPPVAGG